MLIRIIQELIDIQDTGVIIIGQINMSDPELIEGFDQELKQWDPAQGRKTFKASAALTGELDTDTHTFLVSIRKNGHTTISSHVPVAIAEAVPFFPRYITQTKQINYVILRPDRSGKRQPVDKNDIFLFKLFFQLFHAPYVF